MQPWEQYEQQTAERHPVESHTQETDFKPAIVEHKVGGQPMSAKNEQID